MITDIKSAVILVLVLCLLGLGVTSVAYWGLYTTSQASLKTTQGELADLRTKVEEQNSEAAAKLKRMTAQRDERQTQLDKAAKTQEKTDADAKFEIARLGRELAARPIVVRYVLPTAATGSGGGSAAGHGAASAEAGAGHTSTGAGLLPQQNSERLGAAIDELELMSAAYASCRARLIPTQANQATQGL